MILFRQLFLRFWVTIALCCGSCGIQRFCFIKQARAGGVPYRMRDKVGTGIFVELAQLVEHKVEDLKVAGSNPAFNSFELAQSAEHKPFKLSVGGSNPSFKTNGRTKVCGSTPPCPCGKVNLN